MVDAGQHLIVAMFLQTDQRTFMRTAVHHRIKGTVFIAGDDNRDFTDEGGFVIAVIGNINFQAQEIPMWSSKNLFVFQRVYVFIEEYAVRHARHAFFRPN
jgi:hypothetical protein